MITQDNLVDSLRESKELMHEVSLILQKKDAVLECAICMGYYCPICYVWYTHLDFTIVTKNITFTPRYQCPKCHHYLRRVLYENYEESPWQCKKCGCTGKMTTVVGDWD